MFPNISPKKMQEVMKQMGMSQEEINAVRVTIEEIGGKKIVIENPSVTKIRIQDQESFQISGDVSEQEDSISEGDIKTVMEKTNCTENDARKALEKADGNLAEAILDLS